MTFYTKEGINLVFTVKKDSDISDLVEVKKENMSLKEDISDLRDSEKLEIRCKEMLKSVIIESFLPSKTFEQMTVEIENLPRGSSRSYRVEKMLSEMDGLMQRVFERIVVDKSKDVISAAVNKEDFLDNIVDRIKRKQV